MAADPSAFAFLTRRRVLGLGLAGVGALVVGGVGLRVLIGAAPPVAGLYVLDSVEYRSMSLLAQTIIPDGGPFEIGASKYDLARAFDGYLRGEPEPNVTQLKRALLLFELGPLLFERRLTTFSALSPAERLRHYRAWAESDTLVRRQVAVGFRKFLALVFYDQAEVWPHIGYPGPSLGRRAP